MTHMSYIECNNLSLGYDGKAVVEGLNFKIGKGDYLCVLGENGAGKSTLIKTILGLIDKVSGDIIYADGLKAYEIGYLPQQTVVQKDFPATVWEVVLSGTLAASGFKPFYGKREKELARQKMEELDIWELKKKCYRNLSGGQQQRVAIARALVNEPKVLLLDEPLGALDLKLRKEMQKELKKIQQEVGITFIFVTHDQEEALTMSDKIVVMKDGVIQQIGNPTQIYNEPANRYVANFIGESNIIEGVMKDDRLVVMNGKPYECVDYGFEKNENVDVVLRPEDIDIVAPEDGKIVGTVKNVLFKGVHYETLVETRTGTSITIKMTVYNDEPVLNSGADEAISANDFYLDISDIPELTDMDIVARANAAAWKISTEESISINKIDYKIEEKNGTYPVTFTTSSGTSITVNMIVEKENKVVDSKYGEVIYAVNIFKSVDDIVESIALDTDLKTWANAQAWTDDEEEIIEVTDVIYDFDPKNIEPGEYSVTFKTRGNEYKVDTTDQHFEGDRVGLTFTPNDLHIMRKGGL